MKTNGTAIDAGSFDYIVTGAGSAGCAVAARLGRKASATIRENARA